MRKFLRNILSKAGSRPGRGIVMGPLVKSSPWTWVTLLQCSVVALAAQDDPFISQRWQIRDDLPDAEVRDVLQTKDGYIWVATPEGVARYTGVHFGIQFQVFHSGNTPTMPNNFCNALAEDSTGALWVGLDSGHVLRLDRTGFGVLQAPTAWPEAPITRMVETMPGRMLVLNRAGLMAEFATDRPSRILTNMPPGGVRDLIRDCKGMVWLLGKQEIQPLASTGAAPLCTAA